MDFRDRTAHSINKKAVTLIVLAILVLVNILSTRLFVRFDWTKNDQYSISDATVSMLAELDDIVTVKAFFSEDLPPQFLPVRQYVQDILGEYEAYGSGNFDFEFVDPQADTSSAQEASRAGVQQVRMQVRENDSFQVKNGWVGIGIFYQGKTESIPVVQQETLGTLEYDLTSLIVKMSQPRPLVVGFLQGHGEKTLGSGVSVQQQQGSDDLSLAAQLLRKNYQVKTLNFAQQQTLEGVDVLVVAGAKRDLTERAVFEIDQFLLAGGKAIFLVDAIEQLEGGVNVQPVDINLKNLFQPYGITIASDVLLDTISELTNFSEGPGRFFLLQYPPFIRLVSQNFSSHPVVAKIESFVVRFVSSIEVSEQPNIVYDAFANTSPTGWKQDFPFNLAPNSIPNPTPEQGGSKVVGVALEGRLPRISQASQVPALQEWRQDADSEDFQLVNVAQDDFRRGREVLTEAQADAKVIIFSDSDFISDRFQQQDQSSLAVFLNMVDHMVLGDALIDIRSKSLSGARIRDLESSEKNLMKFMGILLVPILISGYGFIRLWVRRKEEKLLKI